MTKKLLAIVIATLLIVGLFAGCGVTLTYEGVVDGVVTDFMGTRVYFHSGESAYFHQKPNIVIGNRYRIRVKDKKLIGFINLSTEDK